MCAAVRSSAPSPAKLISGKYVLLSVLGLGIAAGGGWWYQYRLQQRPLALWGPEAAQLILRAGEVEFCRLEPPTTASPSTVIEAEGASFELLDCRDAARMRGMLHLRHCLLRDYSFDWTDRAAGNHDWRYALRFRDGDKTATLLISADFNYVLLLETGAKASIKPIARGIQELRA